MGGKYKMGTNYYFELRNVDVEIVAPLMSNDLKNKLEEVLNQKINTEIQIHIGKRSAGWKPIFEANEYFDSVKGIIDFYNNNKDNLIIKNEYDEELTFHELERELIDWNQNDKKATYQSCDYKDAEGYCFIRGNFC